MDDIRLQIMRLLLNNDEDLSIREISRRLEISSGHVHYHLRKLVKMGVLIREEIEDNIYYTPQALFTEKIDEVIETLMELSELIDDPNEIKISNCIMLFLKCYNFT